MQSDLFTFQDSSRSDEAANGHLRATRIAVQPNMSLRGWPTTAGSTALEGFVALEDATVITRLRRAGAAVIGSARMSELGFGLAGDTLAHVLSHGHADIGLMTDTMGEARIAAASAGFVGFKPSYGIVSRFGLIGLVPSMECFGILAKKLQDVAAVVSVIAGQDDHDFSMTDEAFPDFDGASSPAPGNVIVGIIEEYRKTLDPVEDRAFQTGLAALERAGCTIREVRLNGAHLSGTVHNVIASVEASSSAGKYDGVRYGHRTSSAKNWNEMYLKSRGESFTTLVKTYLFQGAYFQFENYPAFENACRLRRRLVEETRKVFADVDCIASLTRRRDHDAYTAVTIAEVYDAFATALSANVTGQPALQIPGVATVEDEDLGLHLTGPRLRDHLLLSVAGHLLEKAQGV